MSSKRIQGVLFCVYPDDHGPMHAHAKYADIEVIVDVAFGGTVQVSERNHAIRPTNAKKSDIRKILDVAREYGLVLVDLWSEMHS